MNLQEAYSVLELDNNAEEKEVKKAFRKLAAKHHPDTNKDPNTETKFKQINEAYQTITNPPEQNFNPFQGGMPEGLQDFLSNGFFNFGQNQRHIENITLNTTISFEESILGTKKDIKFSRKIKCNSCNGKGKIVLDNGCNVCKGKGKTTTVQGNTMYQQTCQSCKGKTNSKDCTCKDGTINSEISKTVNIPGGVTSENILRIQSMGNFINSQFNQDQYTDAHLHITVTPHESLILENDEVIYNLTIPLLEALQGSTKEVPTVLGTKSIEINKLSKHKDCIIIPKVGINKQGNQKVILNVEYPSDINKLVSLLSINSNLGILEPNNIRPDHMH